MPKNFRARRTSSASEEDETETDHNNSEETSNRLSKIEELKFIQKQRERKHGIDVYSLAIGEQDTSKEALKAEQIDNDPWKKKTGGLVDMKVLQEKRGNEIVTSMASNFARETNQRDEDAEMQKFIDEQIALKNLSEKQAHISKEDEAELLVRQEKSDTAKFKKPEDALFDLPKYLIENKSKHRSEESLSEQMLSGIPEVDLGVSERIRNIEETEKARQIVISKTSTSSSMKYDKRESNSNDSQYAPHNTSVNFVQHKRFDDTLINPDHMVKPRINRPNTVNKDTQPVVGDAPKHELLQLASQQSTNYKKSNTNTSKPNPNARRQYHVSTNMNEDIDEHGTSKMPINNSDEKNPSTSQVSNDPAKKPHKRPNNPTEKASDDYCLERFKKNMRHNRSSKIKIA